VVALLTPVVAALSVAAVIGLFQGWISV